MNSSGSDKNRMEGLRMKDLRWGNSRHILCQRGKYYLVEGIGLFLWEEKLIKTINLILKIWRGVTYASLWIHRNIFYNSAVFVFLSVVTVKKVHVCFSCQYFFFFILEIILSAVLWSWRWGKKNWRCLRTKYSDRYFESKRN